jgi:hypothetical protein
MRYVTNSTRGRGATETEGIFPGRSLLPIPMAQHALISANPFKSLNNGL